jgi:tetrahydromethanopterin:alpha-L-glutamate ligase
VSKFVNKPMIALWSDTPGWHCRKLKAAFNALGVDTRNVAPQGCEFDTTRESGLYIPGFGDELPAGVFVRGIPAGSFEQVTFRLSVLHALEARGVPIYNSARMIERTVDKATTSFLLHSAGVSTPATWVTESVPRARRRLMQETSRDGGGLVVKPLFGAEGKGLVKLTAGDALPEPQTYQSLYYLQRFIASEQEGMGHDYRVFVIGGVARFVMSRHSEHWIHNVAQGARCKAQILTPELAAIAQRAVAAIGLDYAGVDVMRTESGELTVLEVNGVPAWRGLQSVHKQDDIASSVAQDFVSRKLGLAQPVKLNKAQR